MRKPAAAGEAQMLSNHLEHANRSDQELQKLIDQFKAGTSQFTQQRIEINVQQAMQFYSGVDARLTRLESL